MLLSLDQSSPSPDYGGKINALIEICQLGLPVSPALILSEPLVSSWWKKAVIKGDLVSFDLERLSAILTDFSLPKSLAEELLAFMEADKSYIVRSSALLEDGAEASFAGQYQSISSCRSLRAIEQAIRQCILSLFSDHSLAYGQRQHLSWSDLGLALLIQEEVEARVSGVAFSLAPQSGQDQTLLIECVQGAGKSLVDGRSRPEQIRLAWSQTKFKDRELLSAVEISHLQQSLLMLFAHFGRPLDIEFSFVGSKLYLLQARPITVISNVSQSGRWTRANFRDGGVSAQSCPQLMWSLYRQAWQDSLSAFMLEAALVKEKDLEPLIQLKFARPYWNLGLVKQAMAQIPGYIEKDFDDELGVAPDYHGQGRQVGFSLKGLSHLLLVARRIQQISKTRQSQAQPLLEQLLNSYQSLERAIAGIDPDADVATLESLWLHLVNEAQLQAESHYFRQVFINTVQLSMKKTALLKIIRPADLFDLLAHLGNVSHLKPLAAVLAIVDQIQADPSQVESWKRSDLEDLVHAYEQEPNRKDFQAIRAFQRDFGYHSKRELNLLVASYSEDVRQVMNLIQGLIQDQNKLASLRQSLQPQKKGDQLLADLSLSLTGRHYAKLKKKVAELRDLLWWREEFKDISTRYYHLIRQLTLKLGQTYVKQGFIKQADHLFFLEKEDTQAFIEGKISQIDLQKLIDQGFHYYQSYRNFEPPSDLYEQLSSPELGSGQTLQGLVANGGRVTAPVRVISDLSQIDQLQPGEILVTRYTDTGWSYAFGLLAGLITDYGGVLCHASIVARECGLPAIVCANKASQRLKTGMLVTLDGYSGQIIIHEKE